MNADEIVRALRNGTETCAECQYYGEPCGCNRPDGECDGWDIGQAAADLIERQQSQLAESQRRERAAVEMLIKFIKQSYDACDYCKNLIECKGEGCECFEQGKGGTSDGKEYPDFKWTCEDFDHGTCRMMKNTPCNGCFENDCSGFEWRGPRDAGKGEAE